VNEQEENVANQTCPKCNGLNVKDIETWEVSKFAMTGRPKHMWVCKNPTCSHQWPKVS
jgi:hypothetical protein